MLATWIFIFVRWGDIPNQIPMQTDYSGNVTRWGDKSSIIVLPLILLALFVFMTFIEKKPKLWKKRIAFKKVDYSNPVLAGITRNMMTHLKFMLVLLFSTITIFATFAASVPVWLVFTFIGLIVVSIIFYTVKMMRNGG